MNARVLLLVVGLLGLTLLGCIVGIVVLAIGSNPIPDVLQNIAVGSLTGLVGLLVPSTGGTDG